MITQLYVGEVTLNLDDGRSIVYRLENIKPKIEYKDTGNGTVMAHETSESTYIRANVMLKQLEWAAINARRIRERVENDGGLFDG